MEITEEQKEIICRWIEQGLSLAQIQERLARELTLSMTYMEVRFLLDDLNLTLRDTPEKNDSSVPSALDKASQATPESSPAADSLKGEETPEATAIPGNVQVELNPIKKFGSLVSGSVVFSDGVKAEWSIDPLGQLGLNPTTPGYQPNAEDLQAFQERLHTILQQKGF